VQTFLRENGPHPTEANLALQNPFLSIPRAYLRPSGREFFMSWRRPLSQGFSIYYNSAKVRT
jgi:hypothetical protein